MNSGCLLCRPGLVDAVYAASGGVAWISDFYGKLAALQANPLATPASTAIAGTSGVVFMQLGT